MAVVEVKEQDAVREDMAVVEVKEQDAVREDMAVIEVRSRMQRGHGSG